MQNFVKDAELEDRIFCDSAGTIGYHSGQKADARMREHARGRGYELLSRSRQFETPDDFKNFDYIVVMDEQNLKDVRSFDENNQYQDKVFLMTDFCTKIKADHVPDPYYDGDAGFERVLDIVEDGCGGLLTRIKQELKGS